MTQQELDQIESALRAEHHSEWRWTHQTCLLLLKALRVAQRERDDYCGAHKLALERVTELEAALRKLLKHEPWPPTDASASDFAKAGLLVPEKF
jgi:hypothetical protein